MSATVDREVRQGVSNVVGGDEEGVGVRSTEEDWETVVKHKRSSSKLGTNHSLTDSPGLREETSRPDQFSSGRESRSNPFDILKTRGRNNGNVSVVQCFNCKEQGHYKRDCTKPKVIDCYNCGEVGHRAVECRNKRKEQEHGGRGEGAESRHQTGGGQRDWWESQQQTSDQGGRSYARVTGETKTSESTSPTNYVVGMEVGKVGAVRKCLEVQLDVDRDKAGNIDQKLGKKVLKLLGG